MRVTNWGDKLQVGTKVQHLVSFLTEDGKCDTKSCRRIGIGFVNETF